jgi:hypothetical protein
MLNPVSFFIHSSTYTKMSAATTTRQRGNKATDKASDVASSFSDSAKRQLSEVKDVASDAVVSGTWAYPLLVSSGLYSWRS